MARATALRATIKRTAVFVRKVRSGYPDQVIRKPYDIVEYDWGGNEKKTFLQLRINSGPNKTERGEVYDDIVIWDKDPDWDITNDL